MHSVQAQRNIIFSFINEEHQKLTTAIKTHRLFYKFFNIVQLKYDESVIICVSHMYSNYAHFYIQMKPPPSNPRPSFSGLRRPIVRSEGMFLTILIVILS